MDEVEPKDGLYLDSVGDVWLFDEGRGQPLTVSASDGSYRRPALLHERDIYSKNPGEWAPFTEVKA
jgi:hypothetical protein